MSVPDVWRDQSAQGSYRSRKTAKSPGICVVRESQGKVRGKF